MPSHKRSLFQALSGPQLGILVAGTLLVLLIATDHYLQSRRPAYVPTDLDRLLMLAKAHPDETIRKDLIASVASGKLVLDTAVLGASTNGTFSAPGGKPTITIDAPLLVAAGNRSGQEIAFAVLTHEYEHYLQWLHVPAVRTIHAAYAANTPLNAEQCVLKVANESDAYVASCEAARRYQWHAAIANECESIGNSQWAARFAGHVTDLPECLKTWNSMMRQDLPAPVPATAEQARTLVEHSEGADQ
ncbi:MAG: hypothetical protein QY323_04225 [Patescibacteria group bacterium]|nr:MAG: hypothetical protein QY323_04225 [Patescibacteria group bacterium]